MLTAEEKAEIAKLGDIIASAKRGDDVSAAGEKLKALKARAGDKRYQSDKPRRTRRGTPSDE